MLIRTGLALVVFLPTEMHTANSCVGYFFSIFSQSFRTQTEKTKMSSSAI